MHKLIRKKQIGGFTLIELILYVSLAAVMLLSISVFLSLLLEARVKSQVIAEVDQQGVQLMQLITQAARNAESINSPSRGSSASAVSLDVFELANDPTIFDIASGKIRVTEGVGETLDLNSSRIVASSLTFRNLSKNNGHELLSIEFTLTHDNPDNRQEYEYQKTFSATASLR